MSLSGADSGAAQHEDGAGRGAVGGGRQDRTRLEPMEGDATDRATGSTGGSKLSTYFRVSLGAFIVSVNSSVSS